MLYVKVPKDLRDYKQKVYAGRTAEELFWIALALILGVLTYIGCMFTVGTQIGSYVTMAVAFPLFICGFVKIQDLTALEFVKRSLRYYTRKQVLTYHNDYLVDNKKKEKPSKERKKFLKEIKKMNENM